MSVNFYPNIRCLLDCLENKDAVNLPQAIQAVTFDVLVYEKANGINRKVLLRIQEFCDEVEEQGNPRPTLDSRGHLRNSGDVILYRGWCMGKGYELPKT